MINSPRAYNTSIQLVAIATEVCDDDDAVYYFREATTAKSLVSVNRAYAMRDFVDFVSVGSRDELERSGRKISGK